MRSKFICLLVLCLSTGGICALPVTNGLIIHLRADSLALSDGAAVSSWADSATGDTVNGTVSQVTGYGVPVFVTNAYNGKPAVRFTRPADPSIAPDSEKQILQSDDWSWNEANGVTVVIVATGGIGGSAAQRCAQVGKSAGGNYRCVACDAASSTSSSGARFNNGYCLTNGASPFNEGDWHISIRKIAQGARYDSGYYSVNGVQQTMTSNYPTRLIAFEAAANNLTLGNGRWGDGTWTSTEWYDGDIAEVLVYNAQLTTQQMQELTSYLQDKYAFVAQPPVTEGLIIHLSADSLGLEDNEQVAIWYDSAISDSIDGTVMPAVGTTPPIFKNNLFNGKPAVRFDGALSQVLASGLWNWDQTKGVTLFMVCTGGPAQNQRAVQVGKSGGAVYQGMACEVGSTSNVVGMGSGMRFNNGYCITSDAGANPVQQGVLHLSVRQLAQGGAYGGAFYCVNDQAYTPRETNAPTYNIAWQAAGNDILVGAGWQNNAFLEYYTGDMAEILVYNQQLTPSQIKQVSSYLNSKYNVYPYTWGDKFTIVAIPDSQGYPNHVNQPESTNLFIDEMQWIVDNANAKNIVFATHEGDAVMVSGETQYDRAVLGIERLKNTIPFGLAPGNHDYDDNADPIVGSTLWNNHFGPTKDYFRDKSWYGGAYISALDTSGMTTYQEFSTAEIDFLNISLECEANDDVLAWAQGVIDAHPGWPTIITVHKFIALDASYQPATLRDGLPRNNTQQIWDEFVTVNPQIFMILCGHFYNLDWGSSARRVDTNSAGYPVYTMMADYQGAYSGDNLGKGGGWVRTLQVDPVANTVRVRTYSTILNKYSNDASLTDGSTYARTWAAFNYANEGTGDLYAESHYKSSTFTIPFIYGEQLPPPGDVTTPTPNPMTWASVPAATSSTTVTMTATAATDASGVEYYFDETSGNTGGTDSGWQASPIYTDTGLTELTSYSYTVKARDLSANYNETAVSTVANVTTPDGTAPTPDPMTWAVVPAAISSTEITMTATTATDPSGVEYYFDETSGNPGGTDSGWQASPAYTDTGLSELTSYSYTVKARDLSTAQNETAVSSVGNATTPDTTPPAPDPMTWASVPAATSSTTVTMTATTASDASGVEYYFDETTGNPGATDSGWQTIPSYTDTGLSELTSYSYTVKARDLSANHNETAASTVGNVTTPDGTAPTPNPMTWASVPAATSSTTVTMTATTATDASGVEYYFDETTGHPGGTDSGWQTSPSYTDTGLSDLTSYSYTVKARDLSANHNETAVSTVGNVTTPDATAPTPNPMTWASVPAATGTTAIAMTATTASDPSGVEYYFDETSGNPGATDSGWQSSPSYTDTGLNPGTTYSYTVKARDLSTAQNETGVSTVGNATTNTAVPTFVAAGAVASGTAAITPALPSGIAAGDILLLFVETSNQTITITNENGGTWTNVTNAPQYCGTSGGTTGVRIAVKWSRYNGTQGAPTLADSGDHELARIIAIRGAVASGDPWNITAGGVEAVDDTSGSIPGATTTVANTLVVTAIATSLPDASSTANFSGWTNANLTSLTERTDNTVTAGNGGGLAIATGVKATAGAYGNTGVTLVNAAYKAMISIAIKP